MQNERWDIIIVGTGAGGGTLAGALAHSGLRILVLERGGFLPQEDANWDAKSVFQENRYKTKDTWLVGPKRKAIRPYEYYFVGGKTKLYGSALMRFREVDFAETVFPDGLSPAWPVSYSEFEPYYTRAEKMYGVHGDSDADATRPRRSANYSHGAMAWDPFIQKTAEGLRRQGVKPFSIPLGIDYRDGKGKCTPCQTCDGYPCKLQAKNDAETCGISPALQDPNIVLRIQTKALRVLADRAGRVHGVEVESPDRGRETLKASQYVIACGAIPSAALLLNSEIPGKSDLIGRNLMFHIHTGMVGLHPFQRNSTVFQKTIAVTEYCDASSEFPFPAGSLQFLGRYPFEHLGLGKFGRFITDHSFQLTVLSEDLPKKENRVLVENGQPVLQYQANNMAPHRWLVGKAKRLFKGAGVPIVLAKHVPMPTHAGAHACGSLPFGRDPKTSVLDPFCRVHGVENLFVVDSSFFPSSGSVNPALTVMAQSLRVAEHLREIVR